MPPGAWIEIASNVWLRRYDFAEETVGLVMGREGLVLVDTRATEAHGEQLLRDIRAFRPQPIRAVVNTHGHWDHAFGNARFVGLPIWGHVRCPAFMATTAEPMKRQLTSMPQFADHAEAIRQVRVTPPTHLFSAHATIDLGGRLVILEHLGRGHTDSDIIVTIPDAGVVFVGDLVKGDGPPGYRNAYPNAWVATGRQLVERVGGSLVVPGHGPVVDRAFAEAWVRTLGHTASLATRAASGELSHEVARASATIHPRAMDQAILCAGAEIGAIEHL